MKTEQELLDEMASGLATFGTIGYVVGFICGGLVAYFLLA